MKLIFKTLLLSGALATAPLWAADATADKPSEEVDNTAWLGVASSSVDELIATQLDLPEGVGVAIRLLLPDSPADKAGLKKHDVLFEFEGQAINSPQHLGELVRSKSAGDSIELSIIQRGAKKNIEVELGSRPEHIPQVPDDQNQMPGQLDLGDIGRLQFKIMPLDADADLDGDAAEAMKKMREQMEKQFRGMLKLEELKNLPGAGQIVGLSSKTMKFNDADGTVTIRSKDGVIDVTSKDKEGSVVFEGPANTAQEREALPQEIREKLERFESSTIDLDFKGFKLPDPTMRVPGLKPGKKVEPKSEEVPPAKKDGEKAEI
jgi:hypothetical protein